MKEKETDRLALDQAIDQIKAELRDAVDYQDRVRTLIAVFAEIAEANDDVRRQYLAMLPGTLKTFDAQAISAALADFLGSAERGNPASCPRQGNPAFRPPPVRKEKSDHILARIARAIFGVRRPFPFCPSSCCAICTARRFHESNKGKLFDLDVTGSDAKGWSYKLDNHQGEGITAKDYKTQAEAYEAGIMVAEKFGLELGNPASRPRTGGGH